MSGAAHAGIGEFEIRSVRPLNESQLLDIREFVVRHPDATVYASSLALEAQPLLEATPDPIPVIHYEGLVNTDPKRIETVGHLREMDDIALLLRYWQLSGDPSAEATLKRFIRAWARIYEPTGNDVNENKFFPLYIAYGQIREAFDPAERGVVDAWMEEIAGLHAGKLENATRLTNRFNKSVRMLAVIGMALNRPEWVELADESARRFVRESLRGDGTSYDLEHRDTLTYHGSALKPIIEIALIRGPAAGAELYFWENEAGGSVAKSVAYVVPYARGEKVHEEWVESKVELDRERAAAGLEKYQPGRLYEPKQAFELLDLASGIEPSLAPLAKRLSDDPEAPFSSWNGFLAAALR